MNSNQESTQDFIEKLRKRKFEGEKIEKVHEETVAEYSKDEIEGLNVAHNMSEFIENTVDKEQILVLNDTNVLDEDQEDELVNVEALEQERIRRNNENKKKESAYKPYEEESASLLSKYDEEIEGIKKSKFKIADLKNGKPEEKPNLPENYTIDTLDISYLKESNDYMAVDSTIKKSKKKRKIRTKPIDKEDLLDFTETGNLIDDFDLQKELSKTRTKKLNKMKILTAEEIAQNILEEKTYGSINDDNDNKKGLVISSTSEFVKNLCSKKDSQPPIDSKPKVNLESLKVTPAPVKREEIKADDNVEMEIETTMEIPNENETSDADLAPVIEEPLVRSGVAATLSLLGQSGVLTSKDIVTDKDALGIEHSEWLAQQRQLEKERLAQKAKLRDKNDHYKEIQKSRDIERKKIEKFKDYKPEIKLEYFDDFGRKLAPKDAFRQLCYQFHGHKPGKNKTDKILRKIKEEEDLKMAMEKSLSANSALENARKAAGTSHVLLTSGNKVVLSDKVPKKLLKEVRKRQLEE